MIFSVEIHVGSPAEMQDLGWAAAKHVRAGSCIALVGGLGAGKTHWVKGFARGMGSQAEVTSPTFGLMHEYLDGRNPIFHLDFYRLESAEELLALGWDEILEQNGVVIVEWGDKFPELLPADTVWFYFSIEQERSRIVRQTTNHSPVVIA